MVFKMNSENARKSIAILSVILSILAIIYAVSLSDWPKELGQHIFIHICLLQIIASIILFIGSRNTNQWFFLPWLLIAFAFAYYLIYMSLFLWLNLLNNVKSFSIFIALLYIIAGFWFYFIHAVYVDFVDMQDRAKEIIKCKTFASNEI